MLKYCDTLPANADQQNANNLLSNKCMQGGRDVIFCLSAYRGDLYPLRSFLFLLFCAWMQTHASSLLLSCSYLQPYLNLKWQQKLFKVCFFFLCMWQIVWPPHTHTHLSELICRLQWHIMITRPIKSLIWGKCRYLLNPHYQSCWWWVSCLFLSPSIDVFFQY